MPYGGIVCLEAGNHFYGFVLMHGVVAGLHLLHFLQESLPLVGRHREGYFQIHVYIIFSFDHLAIFTNEV